MKKKILFIILLFLSLVSYSQGEANIWYFGEYAGLDFNSGSPVPLTNGQLFTYEGCATISDSFGQLLFYTDGGYVFNRNHQVMVNGTGLMGNESSTQSAIIVKKPNSATIYYIFTSAELGTAKGVRYSEVDLSQDGGLGAVTSNKNILLVTPACEKLTAVKDKTGDAIWVITHGFGNNNFYAFSIDNMGVNQTPVISSTGVVANPVDGIYSIGYIKVAPLGDKLICSNRLSLVELFDFNNATGVVSNPRLITDKESNYGAEFSQSGKIAYITTGKDIHGDYELNQYDLTSNNIPGTELNLFKTTDQLHQPLGLQLAPDGKIYLAIFNTKYLSEIANPNILGNGCNFKLNAVGLNSRIAYSGLPQFIQSYFLSTITVQNNCFGQATSFSLNSDQEIIVAQWDFGDGTTSEDINPTHVYATTGNYTVSVKATSNTGITIKNKDIVIYTTPTATKPQDILVCDSNNDGFSTFDLTSQNGSILNGQDATLYSVNYFANATDYANNVSIATPTNYTNNAAYQQQSIIAEVSNIANISCKSTTSFSIAVFEKPMPKLSSAIPKLALCDNTSVGTDTDGRAVFDLTQRATAILNGQSVTQFVLSYYKDAVLTQNISNPTAYQNTNANETVYVKVVNKDNLNCTAVTSFEIEVMALPTINNVVDLKQCDDNTDGFSVFNLEEAIAKISPNWAVETISFHKTIADAQNNVNPIVNRTAYTNQTVSTDKVFVRVANSNSCYRIAQLNLIVSTTQIPATFSRTFTECDDVTSGSNTDGIAAFDFSSVDNEVLTIFPSGQLLDITYYKNLADALVEKNAIADISNYNNIGYPNTQTIYIRVDSRLNNDCLGLGSYITLKVEPVPIIAPIVPFVHCDDDQDGFYAFDITGLDSQIKNGKDVVVTYFDANNNPLPSPLPNPFVTASQTIQATITNNTTTACSYNISIPFVVDDLPEAFPVATLLTTACDDEIDPSQQDGKYAFDISSFQNTILGNQTGMIVKYFDQNNIPLSSPLPNPFVTGTQNVRVEVVNPGNANCVATTTIPFIVNPVPNIALEGDELVCSNLPTFTKVIDAGIQDATPIANYSYAWFFNGEPIVGENNYTLTVNTEGTYTVEVTNSQGCFRTRTITVSASDIAVINDVDIVELSDSNSITVSVSGNGDYVYALDDEFGAYQTENNFMNVSAGIHTVFVKDLNGCGVVPKEVAVLGIPNYFTPNQDGYNDTWNIKGVNISFNAKTLIHIFDRYGKLIKQISPTGTGWDGNFNGNPMPASDYWYSIQLEDGKVMKGHFALKR
ncbi:T9SS type B sorting domain-containing protein [Flavobacterium sp. GSA192]|uniref:T9SS type B sorting domain-containing protein n=1 Tax=Flavobacterium sp. GSA192 TaxID=2576304 RepID=UPI001128799B|nr:T9SS type B sorting domain-containing protein [Flavobacterium sp. GSA192]